MSVISDLESILRKAQGRVDVDDKKEINVGAEVNRIRVAFDSDRKRIAELEKAHSEMSNAFELQQDRAGKAEAKIAELREDIRRLLEIPPLTQISELQGRIAELEKRLAELIDTCDSQTDRIAELEGVRAVVVQNVKSGKKHHEALVPVDAEHEWEKPDGSSLPRFYRVL